MSAPTPRATVDVAVNLLWCVTGQVGGSEEYLVRQLAGLADVDRVEPGDAEFDVTIHCPAAFASAHADLGTRHRYVIAPVDGTSRAKRIVAEHTWLARRTRSAALVHHGGGTAPATPGHPPIVLTVHDLQYETYPHYIAPAKLRYLRWAMPRSVARAAVITVPTDYVRTTVVDRFDADPDRVIVVPHGVEPELGTDAPTEADLRERYGLGEGPVVVFPAVTHPHKGHLFLLDVLATEWTDPDLRLVLLGGAGSAEAAVEEAIRSRRLAGRVVRPGRVPAADRDGLVALASALAFPSEYEGFGAPVVEAMALGAPVICSDIAPLREVVAGAGLVTPLEVSAWGAALDDAVARREELVAAGRERAARYTSLASGAALAAAYRLAVSVDGRAPSPRRTASRRSGR